MSDQQELELTSFLISQGHSEERAKQILGNHREAVISDFEKWKRDLLARMESADEAERIRKGLTNASEKSEAPETEEPAPSA